MFLSITFQFKGLLLFCLNSWESESPSPHCKSHDRGLFDASAQSMDEPRTFNTVQRHLHLHNSTRAISHMLRLSHQWRFSVSSFPDYSRRLKIPLRSRRVGSAHRDVQPWLKGQLETRRERIFYFEGITFSEIPIRAENENEDLSSTDLPWSYIWSGMQSASQKRSSSPWTAYIHLDGNSNCPIDSLLFRCWLCVQQ